jgi:hypothetical protein
MEVHVDNLGVKQQAGMTEHATADQVDARLATPFHLLDPIQPLYRTVEITIAAEQDLPHGGQDRSRNRS